jgi:prepilin-type N-terminal cleavage/methylation domain-containing protein
MQNARSKNEEGFSLLELLIGMTITLILLAVVSSLVSRATSVNSREERKGDALVSAQAALNVMSREIGNSGFGIFTDAVSQTPNNGLVLPDSNANRIHFRSNFENVGDYVHAADDSVVNTIEPGEDVTYYFDNATQSIVRYDPNPKVGAPTTSVIVNRISNVTFQYYNYTTSSSTVTETSTPTSATGRVRITVQVTLDPIVGQPDNQVVTFSSDITLRNSSYMLRQY